MEKTTERITRNNSALFLIDHQIGLLSGVRDIELSELKHNVVALAKAAKILGIPVVAATTAKDEKWGPLFPELLEVLDQNQDPVIDRMRVNAWDDPKFLAAVKATGKSHLLFAAWSPDGAGFTRVSVMDARGATDSVLVRLE